MVQLFRRFCLLLVLALGVHYASGAAFLGPNNEAYQVVANGFNPNPFIDPAPTGPKNLAEEYRRNTPVIYYSFDQNFIDYFGSNGMAAVDAAFEVYNGLTNVSRYSTDLSELPMEARRVNYQAQALFLSDVKSFTMALIAEQMGLAQPERYTWVLHDRWHVGTPPCPAGQNYVVVKRNFDPVFSGPDQLQPSSYVNGVLYSYTIVEYCTTPTPFGALVADAVEFNVDPLADTFTPIASGLLGGPFLLGGSAVTQLGGLVSGLYFTGLTRDDVGGLRYLMRTNNMNIESAGVGTTTFITNTTPQLLFTSNLTEFIQAALTNGPAALTALYPDLQIATTTSIFTNVISTNVVYYFTNYPFEPYGTLPHLLSRTVIETNIATYFSHTFANAYITPSFQLVSNLAVPVVPGHSTANALVGTITTNISSTACGPFSPVGTLCTNVSISQTLTAVASGDFYILPTNLCSISIVSTQLIRTITITNPPTGVIVVLTNGSGAEVGTESLFSQSLFYSYNQYVYVIRPVVCPQNTLALRQGIERIRFVRRDFDSLLNQFFYPETNDYVLNAITNSTLYPQAVRRRITQPDILITASDLAGGPSSGGTFSDIARSLSFDTANTLPNLAGPGTLTSPTAFTFNKVGPAFYNSYPDLGEADGSVVLIWGSFDGSTNAPIVYPNGTSITNIENQVLIQVSPAGPALPDGIVGVNYATLFSGFTVNGGTAPFTWSVAGSALPPGLSLNPTTGVISGVATTQNVYDFVLRVTDATTRFVDLSYSIRVNP